MPVVIPTAIKTASTSYIMLTLGIIVTKTFYFISSLTIPRLTASTRVKAPRRIKLIGNFLCQNQIEHFRYLQFKTYVLRDLTHIIGIITTSVRPKQTYRIQ